AAALNSEPGYANYVLAYVAAFNKDPGKSVRLMSQSYQAGFTPAASALGLILSQGYGVSKNAKQAETFFLRAAAGGHVPAPMLLCRFYMKGDCGIAKMILGSLLFPFMFAYM